jgi:hypothetical protein
VFCVAGCSDQGLPISTVVSGSGDATNWGEKKEQSARHPTARGRTLLRLVTADGTGRDNQSLVEIATRCIFIFILLKCDISHCQSWIKEFIDIESLAWQ